ncbi:MAG: glutamine--fructose-6-phosphate transaminase (isomerizing) [Waddliaceae bacterium]|mgnify:CR=1 FL=1|jgi:glutamine---fructose-6-phosphate transaminase (isomerizing)|nr:glutamine--fructose-6-phosphate transaminase (isomerizing) [Waddliaceae bacterium]MBT3578416.1 glutamine--fructose-6-phosphate transaminase (isomerizing) [Waddliaceae bacterium]MBT4445268.1 glutamine--fructose-6-phosphate transaminase (isomerizing) [Waddliaceae bacterium]MBT6929134.1 glutamine--fructose-6-phosphate transaminase (isomerizing) [Waddliaceae bacterium]MBT7264633.1 glutamine--fructose-6-phosphate transaminase (isomerizing) [Waddliaceae bacterium]
MCGIFGYIGHKDAAKVAIAGLKRLEYRGYDSSGIAGIQDGEIVYCKKAGKIAVMEKAVKKKGYNLNVAIAHTRWATHGKATEKNAHPHLDSNKTLAVVHNGIIENHDTLRTMLEEKGVTFVSETDTEVIAHLISDIYDGDILAAVQKALPLMEGSFAIALVHKNHPEEIVVAARENPLAIGIGDGETFISSDTNSFVAHTKKVVFIKDDEVAVVKAKGIKIYDHAKEPVKKKTETLTMTQGEVSKDGYEHFMLKEIYEQPQTIRNALLSRFIEKDGTVVLEDMTFSEEELLEVERIVILACGTSWHAGIIGGYIIEDKARIPVQVEISSEFRYKNPILYDNTLVIAISQSGETADTIAAMKECRAKGAKILGICNVHGSTIAREADSCLFLRAGTEIGVASTKAFTSQLVVLALFALSMARMRKAISKKEGKEFIHELMKLPVIVENVLANAKDIKKIAKKYAKYDNFFFIGRRYMFPSSLEGALKLKEISYINANAYPAGEMKHGPIALINKKSPIVAFFANKHTYEKMLSNVMEVKARNGRVIAIASKGMGKAAKIADDIIWVPKICDELAPIPSSVAAQLLAYYIAYERGTEIDQPRNLAKSVTVE